MTDALREAMGRAIVDFEARRDKKGRLVVYRLPKGDGGGAYEIAGINDRYHPEQARKLRRLIESGRHAEAEAEAAQYLLAYTDRAAAWSTRPGVEFFLRDCVCNRGQTGAARILQRALGVRDDGVVGPATKKALDAFSGDLLAQLRWAREDYERKHAKRDENSEFWDGLVNRWDKAFAKAREFEKGEIQ